MTSKEFYRRYEGWISVAILALGSFGLGAFVAVVGQSAMYRQQIAAISGQFDKVIQQKDETLQQKDDLIAQLTASTTTTSKAVIDVSRAVIKSNEDKITETEP